MSKLTLAALAVSSLCSCSLIAPFEMSQLHASGDDGGGTDSEVEAGDGGGAGDGRVDGGIEIPGPLPFIAAEVEVLTERFCDLDGNGSLDNSVADLGPSVGPLFAITLNANISGLIEERGVRVGFHFPWVDDVLVPHDPHTRLAIFAAADTDDPVDIDDDLSGEEPFFAWYDSVDSCGEPLFVFDDVLLDQGEVAGEGGAFTIPTIAPARNARIWGTVEADGESAVLEMCGASFIRDLGAGPGFPNTGDLTTLEVLLSGGGAFGIASIPGLEPDLDLDGDGLERINLDVAQHIVECVDGDNTIIAGRDCWQDPRIADGFSVNLRASLVPAVFLGPVPGYQGASEGRCTGGPSAGSLWGVCDEPEHALCQRDDQRSCRTLCGADGLERCRSDCLGWSQCFLDGETVVELESCDDVLLHGFSNPASGATPDPAECTGDPPSIRLFERQDQMRGVSLAAPVTVGHGPIVVEAEVDVRRTDPLGLEPADGWAIVVYEHEPDADWHHLQAGGGELGINWARTGYSVEWRFYNNDDPANQTEDWVELAAVVDSAVGTRPLCGVFRCRARPDARLEQTTDQASSVRQGLRLWITPDDPSTPHDDQGVTAEYRSSSGAWIPTEIGCFGARCPVDILPGDRLDVGVTGAAGFQAAIVDLAAGDLSVEAQNPCD